ncbi:MAG TPA: M28 family peptidase [Lachnospiraceae bacterium]|nr:M28 family peptidase [Lachnospiraceae bacterium]
MKNLSRKKLFTFICFISINITFGSIIANASTSNVSTQSFSSRTSEEDVQQDTKKVGQPSTKRMMATIKALSAGSREYGTSDEKKACNYLKKRFQYYGYEPYLQKEEHLNWDGTEKSEGLNLIAVKKSTEEKSKGVIIICAHYDCSKNSLGANDDASGCAVVLETARLLKDMPSDYELRFILFCGEEKGCLGSLYYAQNLSADHAKDIKAVIDIDSIAQKDYVKPKIFTVSGEENTATKLLTSAKENKELKINKMKRERSDYAVFDHYKMPALCIGQPYTDKLNINNSKDPISQIDKSLLVYVADIIINALE